MLILRPSQTSLAGILAGAELSTILGGWLDGGWFDSVVKVRLSLPSLAGVWAWAELGNMEINALLYLTGTVPKIVILNTGSQDILHNIPGSQVCICIPSLIKIISHYPI